MHSVLGLGAFGFEALLGPESQEQARALEEGWLIKRQSMQRVVCLAGALLYGLYTNYIQHQIRNAEVFVNGRPANPLVRSWALLITTCYLIGCCVILAYLLLSQKRAKMGLLTYPLLEKLILFLAWLGSLLEPWGHQWRLAFIVHGVRADLMMKSFGQEELPSEMAVLISLIVSLLLFCTSGIVRARFSWIVLVTGCLSVWMAISTVSSCSQPMPAARGWRARWRSCTSQGPIPVIGCSDLKISVFAMMLLAPIGWIAQCGLEASYRRRYLTMLELEEVCGWRLSAKAHATRTCTIYTRI